MDYKPTVRRIGDEVFSTGFHTSVKGYWVKPCAKGVVTGLNPTVVEFEGEYEPIGRVAVMRSDVRPTMRAALSVAGLPRTNSRWNQ